MSKVFATQYVKNHNYSEAESWGEVVFLTKEEYRPEPTVQSHNESITEEIRRTMMDYIPGEDYILLTGSAIPNFIVGGILKGYCINNATVKHNILKWSSREQTYELFKVKI